MDTTMVIYIDIYIYIYIYIQVARMPRLIQQEFREERRGGERRRMVGGREGCDGGGESLKLRGNHKLSRF